MEAADLHRAVRHYRDLAPRYDHFTRRINAIRSRTIEALVGGLVIGLIYNGLALIQTSPSVEFVSRKPIIPSAGLSLFPCRRS